MIAQNNIVSGLMNVGLEVIIGSIIRKSLKDKNKVMHAVMLWKKFGRLEYLTNIFPAQVVPYERQPPMHVKEICDYL